MIPHGVEVFVAVEPIDMRLGFDRLAGLAQERMQRSARCGALFLFFGKRRTAIKILFFDEFAFERGGPRRVVMARVKYVAINAQGESAIETAPKPPELLPRCMAAPSALAKVANTKFCDGVSLYQIERMFDRWGFRMDRGTMSKWLEQLGAAFGATIVEAAKKEAFARAFCIMTDATGFAIQPGPSDDGKRRPCRKGHYFVQIVDRDYMFFEFTPKETSAVVRAMFQGFGGYMQADAKSVYDVLFRPSDPRLFDDDEPTPTEVACWAHLRRKFWEAALAKQRPACEALLRIQKIFELDDQFRNNNPPSKIQALRHQHLSPLVHEFLDFAATAYESCKAHRGSLRSAFGYCVRQRVALTRFLEDGRLRLDNNPSESALRKVVLIRDRCLFAGSDDHALAAGHILSLIAMASLHGARVRAILARHDPRAALLAARPLPGTRAEVLGRDPHSHS